MRSVLARAASAAGGTLPTLHGESWVGRGAGALAAPAMRLVRDFSCLFHCPLMRAG